MMTYQMPAAKVFISEGGLSYGRPAPGYPTHSTFGIGGHVALRPSQTRKLPLMLPLNSNQNENTPVSSFIIKGKSKLNKEDEVISEDVDQRNDIFGRHFLFEKTCTKLERTRTTVPPLQKDTNEHRHVKLHPLSLSAELPSIPSARFFTLGQNIKRHYGRSKEPLAAPETQVAEPRNSGVNISPPSTLILSGKNNFSVESCKFSRPKVHYPTYNPATVKDNQKSKFGRDTNTLMLAPQRLLPISETITAEINPAHGLSDSKGCLHASQTYSDPIIGASRSFIHRISELSSLEGETVRHEKIKKISKSKKCPS